MAKISWKQLTYDIAQACRDALGNNNIIKVKDLPDTIRGLNSFSSSTVEPREVTNGEITYNSEGRLIGSAPFTYEGYINTVDGDTNYKVLTNIEDGQSSINISTSPINIDSYAALGIMYGNGKYIIHSGSSILYSTDGNTWTEANYPIPEYTNDEDAEFVDNSVSDIIFMDSAYTNGKFMITAEAVSNFGTYMIYISEEIGRAHV